MLFFIVANIQKKMGIPTTIRMEHCDIGSLLQHNTEILPILHNTDKVGLPPNIVYHSSC